MCSADQRFIFQAEYAASFKHIFPGQMVKLCCTHRPLEFRAADDFTKKLIGLEEDVVLKEDVINSNYPLFPQNAIVQIMQTPPHLQAQAEMCIVIEICACRDHP